LIKADSTSTKWNRMSETVWNCSSRYST